MCGTPHCQVFGQLFQDLGVPVIGRNDFDHHQGRMAGDFLVRLNSGKYGYIWDAVQVGGKPHTRTATGIQVMRFPKMLKLGATLGLRSAMRIVWCATFDNLSPHVFAISTLERHREVFGEGNLH
jgi:hypothetical protein